MSSGVRAQASLPDQQEKEEYDKPVDCTEELTASGKEKTHNLLTMSNSDVCTVLQFYTFSNLNRLIGVATLILRICSLLRAKAALRNIPGSKVMRERLLSNY